MDKHSDSELDEIFNRIAKQQKKGMNQCIIFDPVWTITVLLKIRYRASLLVTKITWKEAKK